MSARFNCKGISGLYYETTIINLIRFQLDSGIVFKSIYKHFKQNLLNQCYAIPLTTKLKSVIK